MMDDFGNAFDWWNPEMNRYIEELTLGCLAAFGFACSARGLLWEWELARKEVV